MSGAKRMARPIRRPSKAPPNAQSLARLIARAKRSRSVSSRKGVGVSSNRVEQALDVAVKTDICIQRKRGAVDQPSQTAGQSLGGRRAQPRSPAPG